MFDVDALDDATQEVKVSYKGQVATVKYAEDTLSGKQWRELSLPANEGEPEYSFNTKFLARVVKGWDIARKGKVVPLTVEAVDGLPHKFTAALADAVMKALLPNPTSPEPTAGSF